jgi:Transcriptional regulator
MHAASSPTEAGTHVIEYFREQMAHKDDLLSRLQELRGLRTGHISVVLGEGFVSDVLAGPMQHFCKQFPGIAVTLDLAGTNEVVRKISEDEGEIGLVYNPPTEPKIVSRAFKRQPMMAIVGPTFAGLGKKKSMSVKELASYPLAATHSTYGTRQMLEAVEFAEKVRLEPVVTTNSIAILKQFVKSGLGITCLSGVRGDDGNRSGRTVRHRNQPPSSGEGGGAPHYAGRPQAVRGVEQDAADDAFADASFPVSRCLMRFDGGSAQQREF